MTTYKIIKYIIPNLITVAYRAGSMNYLPVAFLTQCNIKKISFFGRLIFSFQKQWHYSLHINIVQVWATSSELFTGAPWCDIKTKIRHVTLHLFANGFRGNGERMFHFRFFYAWPILPVCNPRANAPNNTSIATMHSFLHCILCLIAKTHIVFFLIQCVAMSSNNTSTLPAVT